MVFPDRPDCLVLYLPEGIELRTPVLQSPFDKAELTMAFADEGEDVRVSEGTPGQWNAAYSWLHKDERSERGSRHRLAQAVRNAERLAKGGAAASRAEAIQEKLRVDDEVRQLKAQIGEVRSRAFTRNEYIPADAYRKMEADLKTLKDKSQALQLRIGELRDAEKRENEEASRTYAEKFVRAAHAVLSDDLLQRVHGVVRAGDE